MRILSLVRDRHHESCARRLRPRRCLAVVSKKPVLFLDARSLKVMLRSLGLNIPTDSAINAH
jgi:hypothetical protein